MITSPGCKSKVSGRFETIPRLFHGKLGDVTEHASTRKKDAAGKKGQARTRHLTQQARGTLALDLTPPSRTGSCSGVWFRGTGLNWTKVQERSSGQPA